MVDRKSVYAVSTYWLVESHNSSDTSLPEIVTVVIWCKGLEAIVDTSNIGGTRKGQQLACMPQQRVKQASKQLAIFGWLQHYQHTDTSLMTDMSGVPESKS